MAKADARSTEILTRKILKTLLPEDWYWKVAERAARPLIPEAMALRVPLRVRERTAYALKQAMRDVLGDARARAALEKQLARQARSELARDVPRKAAEAAVARAAKKHVATWIEARLPSATKRARAAIARGQKENDALLARISKMDAAALHRFANRYNWDDGSHALDAVVRHPKCALGTALLVYWLAKPYWGCRWLTAKESDDPDEFAMLAHIEAKIAKNGYTHAGIAFDPRKEELPDVTYEGEPKKRLPPAHVFAATTRTGVTRFEPTPIKQKKGRS